MTTILIPKCFHWIWFGPNPLPEQHRCWIDGWLSLHPGWEHNIWTDATRFTLTNEEQFLSANSFAQKADIARYEILYRFGGIYVDTDTECLRSIEPLLPGVAAFGVEGKPGNVEISPIGAIPKHPWLADTIAQLPHSMQTGWGIRDQTGPKFFTRITQGRSDVTIFEERLFTSVPVDESKRSQAYSIHHAAWSWEADSDKEYSAKFRELLSGDLEPIIPAGALFIMVDKGRQHELGGGRRAVPFPERDGDWAGYPADDAAAMTELERLRRAGAQFIVFPRPMFYWLEAYPELNKSLVAHGRCVLNNDRVLIFELDS